jgi:hypothetical protein
LTCVDAESSERGKNCRSKETNANTKSRVCHWFEPVAHQPGYNCSPLSLLLSTQQESAVLVLDVAADKLHSRGLALVSFEMESIQAFQGLFVLQINRAWNAAWQVFKVCG